MTKDVPGSVAWVVPKWRWGNIYAKALELDRPRFKSTLTLIYKMCGLGQLTPIVSTFSLT